MIIGVLKKLISLKAENSMALGILILQITTIIGKGIAQLLVLLLISCMKQFNQQKYHFKFDISTKNFVQILSTFKNTVKYKNK